MKRTYQACSILLKPVLVNKVSNHIPQILLLETKKKEKQSKPKEAK